MSASYPVDSCNRFKDIVPRSDSHVLFVRHPPDGILTFHIFSERSEETRHKFGTLVRSDMQWNSIFGKDMDDE